MWFKLHMQDLHLSGSAKSSLKAQIHDDGTVNFIQYQAGEIAALATSAVLAVQLLHKQLVEAFKTSPKASTACTMLSMFMFCITQRLRALDVLSTKEQTELTAHWRMLLSYDVIFVVSFLLMMPILWLVPDQKLGRKLAAAQFGEQTVKWVKDFQEKTANCLVRIFVLLSLFLLSSAFSVYHLAAEQAKQAKHHQAEGSQLSMPPLLTGLYLMLLWCSLQIVYERLLGRSLQQDFPATVMQRLFPECLTTLLSWCCSRLDSLWSRTKNVSRILAEATNAIRSMKDKVKSVDLNCIGTKESIMVKIEEVYVAARSEILQQPFAVSLSNLIKHHYNFGTEASGSDAESESGTYHLDRFLKESWSKQRPGIDSMLRDATASQQVELKLAHVVEGYLSDVEKAFTCLGTTILQAEKIIDKDLQHVRGFQEQGFKLLLVADNLFFLRWPMYRHVYLAYTLASMCLVGFTAWEAIYLHMRLNSNCYPQAVAFAALILALAALVSTFAGFAYFGVLNERSKYSSVMDNVSAQAPCRIAAAPSAPQVSYSTPPPLLCGAPPPPPVAPSPVQKPVVCPACCPRCFLPFTKQETEEVIEQVIKEVVVINTTIRPVVKEEPTPVVCHVCNTLNQHGASEPLGEEPIPAVEPGYPAPEQRTQDEEREPEPTVDAALPVPEQTVFYAFVGECPRCQFKVTQMISPAVLISEPLVLPPIQLKKEVINVVAQQHEQVKFEIVRVPRRYRGPCVQCQTYLS